MFNTSTKKSTVNYIYNAYLSNSLYIDGELYGVGELTEEDANEVESEPRFILSVSNKMPKILVFDIETAPFIAYAYSRFKQYFGDANVQQEGYVLCWAAKWLGEENVITDAIWNHHEVVNEGDDYEVCKSLHELFDQADIVIAHNGNSFDIPTMNTRFLYHRLAPNKPYKKIDTLSILKRNFNLPSNKLSSAAIYFGLPNKMDPGGFYTWRGCMNGDVESQTHMMDYNIQDVITLESLYLLLRPWHNTHPNVSLYYDDKTNRCPCCGSQDIYTSLDDVVTAAVTQYPMVICNSCGKVSKHAGKLNNIKGIIRNHP